MPKKPSKTPSPDKTGKLAPQRYEVVPIDSIAPHPRNPRQGDVGSICVSVEANGFYGACVVSARTGRIIAGNHRWMAAKAEGMTEIPAIFLEVDEETELRILLADNKTSDDASYNDQTLADILAEIANVGGPEALTGTGYDGDDLDALIASLLPKDVPDQGAQKEPEIKGDHLVEIYCSKEALAEMQDTLTRWSEELNAEINIS